MMKKITIYIILALIPFLLGAQNIDRSQYNLTFEETFNGLSDINELLSGPTPKDHWQFHPKYPLTSHGSGGAGQELYLKEMVSLQADPYDVTNRVLVLNAEKYETPFDTVNVHRPDTVRQVVFKSGMLQSKNFIGNWPPTEYGFEAYGIFEARIQLPPTKEGKGSFWLFVGGDQAMEIDIVEESKEKELTYTNNVHDWTFSPSQYKQYVKDDYLPPLADDFHVFSVVWTPEKMSFYIDDIEQRSITNDDVRITMDNDFHLDMILSLNPYDYEGIETDEYDMKIDWIKVWKLADPQTCCPDFTTWDGAHCKYDSVTIWPGHEPFISNNTLFCKVGPGGWDDCPEGTVPRDGNCFYNVNIPSQYEGFIWPNDPNSDQHFYAHANCQADPELCCPAGSTYDGANCQYDIIVPDGYEPFVGEDNGLYVSTDENGKCPEGSTETPEGCYMGTTIPTGNGGFVFNNKFYARENCDIDQCCPEGTVWNGEKCVIELPWENHDIEIRDNNIVIVNDGGKECPLGTTDQGDYCSTGIIVPPGFEGVIKDGNVEMEANCESCCPEGYTFDGRDCVRKVYNPGIQIFTFNNRVTTVPDCKKYEEENGCCPEGFERRGSYCKLLAPTEDLTVEQNGFETKFIIQAHDCLDPQVTLRNPSVSMFTQMEEVKAPIEVKLYPNPSSDKIYIDYESDKNDLLQLIIYNATGQIVYLSDANENLLDISEIPVDLEAGIYLISLKFEDQIVTKKIIRL